jgi:HK97 family phage major capsid protein
MLAATTLVALGVFPSGAIFADAGPSEQVLIDLKAKLQGFADENDALILAADTDNRDLSDEELTKIQANTDKIEKINKQIEAREKALGISAGTGRRTVAEPRAGDRAPAGTGARVMPNARGGFNSFGDFAMAVRNGCLNGAQPDDRLIRGAATSYGNEGTGSDGGFLVPPEFSRTIMTKVEAEDGLLTRATPLKTGSNSMVIPKDETTPWQNSGGVQVFWEGEGRTIPQSKGVFETDNMRLTKLTALIPVSDELLEDAPGMESWLNAKAPTKMASKINTAFVRGNGVGMPLGILSSKSLITVAEEDSQDADTVLFANISKMWNRIYAPWRRNAIWLINQDIEPQLDSMAFDPASETKIPVYLPAGGLSASPYASLKGRPVVPMEACSTLGDVGDIILVDMAQYWALTKANGIKADSSIHLYFDQSLTTFRFIFRLNGQPAWSDVIQPENGTTTRSWAVALAERS